MNALGLLLLESAARATAVGVLGLLVVVLVRRRGPAASALAGLTTLVVMLMISLLAPAPWPAWWTPDRFEAVRSRSAVTNPDAGPTEVKKPSRPLPERAATAADPAAPRWGTFADAFGRELTRSRDLHDQEAGWRWPAWLACAFLSGWTIALARLALGVHAVRVLRASGRVVADSDLMALVDRLRGAIGLERPVTIRETAEVSTPATVGWRHPVVLLPLSHRGWTEEERQAVLAHELAHIARGDYLAGLAAQFSLSLHFYHPLAHVLAHRLRFEQELAADAQGARIAGGRSCYLRTLANLALSQTPRPTVWLARPFLPTRGTFLRRIEMLRDPRFGNHSPLLARGRAILITGLVATGLLVAGVRGPGGRDQALAQEPAKAPILAPAIPAAPGLIDPTMLNDDVQLVLELRPRLMLKNPNLKKLADQIPADGGKEVRAIASGQIEQVVVLGLDSQPAGRLGPGESGSEIIVLVRAAQPFDWKTFISAPVDRVERDGITYQKAKRGSVPTCYRELDEQTLLICPETWVARSPLDPRRPLGRHGWDDAWKQLGPGPIRGVFNTPRLARMIQQDREIQQLQQGIPAAVMSMFGPLLNQTQTYAFALDLSTGLTLDALAISATPNDSKQVAATMQALLTLGQNAMPSLRKSLGSGGPQARMVVDAVAGVDSLLKSAKVQQDQAVTRLQARTDSIAPIVALLVPAVTASREAEHRTTSANNLKQIGLALHNFMNDSGAFPPAVLYGPDGKTQYSWRVAILPYIAEAKLSSEYKFDEPWDGPNNIKLLDRMPDVYHDPSDTDAMPGQTSYFVPTGPRTMFPDRNEKMKLAAVTDGLSTTIMAVEAKRPIPWTKPEDIPIDPSQPLPELGGFHPGGANMLFVDGSVRFISQKIATSVLRALFTPAEGDIVAAPQP